MESGRYYDLYSYVQTGKNILIVFIISLFSFDISGLLRNGAGGRTRTDTSSRTQDFECNASRRNQLIYMINFPNILRMCKFLCKSCRVSVLWIEVVHQLIVLIAKTVMTVMAMIV